MSDNDDDETRPDMTRIEDFKPECDGAKTLDNIVDKTWRLTVVGSRYEENVKLIIVDMQVPHVSVVLGSDGFCYGEFKSRRKHTVQETVKCSAHMT